MKLIRGDDNDYKQWKEVIDDNIELQEEIEKLKKQLRLSYSCDEFKDDLIETLKELLISKEALIAEMRERNNQ